MTDETAGGVIAFATQYNTPGINPETEQPWHDADEFQARARAFALMHGGRVHLINDRQPMRRRASEVLDVIDAYDGPTKLICIAWFCHGWSRGIEAGFDLRPAMGQTPAVLATAIARKAGAGVIIPLFCCSTADDPRTPGRTPDAGEAPGGDGGFADQLRDALCKLGLTNCRIDAADKDGHCTRNPRKRRFEGSGSFTGGYGGEWIVAPKLKQGEREVPNPLFATWTKALQRGLDLEFPFLERDAIHRRLAM